MLGRRAYDPLKPGRSAGIPTGGTALAVLALALLPGCARTVAAPPAPPAVVVGEPGSPPGVSAGSRVTREPDRAGAIALASVEGEATYYADRFDGRRTASGIVFRNAEPYAAHRTWPFGTVVRVTNLRNDRSVILRVVDRGPFGSSERARRTIIDVSQSAARELDFIRPAVSPSSSKCSSGEEGN
jgi:rare lipoprotein A